MQKRQLSPINEWSGGHQLPNPMHKIDSVLTAILGAFGFGVSKTLLHLPDSVSGNIYGLLWAALGSGTGYMVKLFIDFLIKRFRTFIALKKSKRTKQ